jgi:hypothetical protein
MALLATLMAIVLVARLAGAEGVAAMAPVLVGAALLADSSRS